MTDLSKIRAEADAAALLSLRPQIWNDYAEQALVGAFPMSQLPHNVDQWQRQFAPHLKATITAYHAHIAAALREEDALRDMAEAIAHEIRPQMLFSVYEFKLAKAALRHCPYRRIICGDGE